MSLKGGIGCNENLLMPDEKIDGLLELAEPQSDCDVRALQDLPLYIFGQVENRNSYPYSQPVPQSVHPMATRKRATNGKVVASKKSFLRLSTRPKQAEVELDMGQHAPKIILNRKNIAQTRMAKNLNEDLLTLKKQSKSHGICKSTVSRCANPEKASQATSSKPSCGKEGTQPHAEGRFNSRNGPESALDELRELRE